MAFVGWFAVTWTAMMIAAWKRGLARWLTVLMWVVATVYAFTGGI